MGDGVSVQRKIRIGQLHGTFIHSGALASSYPNSQALNAPLLFRSFEEVDAVREQFDDELNQGYVLTCQAQPDSEDVVIRYEDYKK